jgi:Family of unknown function (DUF6188)
MKLLGKSGNGSTTFLLGKEVIQIAIGSFSVLIVFEEEIQISCQSMMELTLVSGRTTIEADDPQTTARLVSLLGAKVSSAKFEDNGDLTLLLGSSSQLKIRNSNDQYESFVVWNKGDFIAI